MYLLSCSERYRIVSSILLELYTTVLAACVYLMRSTPYFLLYSVLFGLPSWQSYSTMESSSLLEMTVSPLGLKSKQLILSEFSRNTLATRKLRRTLSVSFMPPGRAALRGGRAEGGRAGGAAERAGKGKAGPGEGRRGERP